MPTLRALLRVLFALFIGGAGVLHFVSPDPFARLIDGFLPYPRALVAFTGVCEIAGAIGLLVPKTRRAAGLALMVFLVAVFPANVRMAVERIAMDGVAPIPDWQAYLRLPLQAVLIAWAWWVSQSDRPTSEKVEEAA